MLHDRSAQWFKGWFDSLYYHVLYKHRNCKEAELFIDNLINYLHPSKKAEILDLGCGKGRHSIYLNRLGFNVSGIDLSEQSIIAAKQFENDHLHFYVHDMRKVFRANYFDFVFNLFTSFGYFENDDDDNTTIEAIEKSLKVNGIFVIDFMNSDKVIKNLIPAEVQIIDGIEFNITRKVENNFIIKDIRFSDKGKEYHFQESVKALVLADFERYFTSNKLKVLNLFGDYSLSAFDLKTSDRLIIIAQKQ